MSDDQNFTNRLADARLVYEGTHGITMHELAEVTGIPKRVLANQSRAEGWAKQVKSGQTEAAAAAVNRFAEWKALVAQASKAGTLATDDSPAAELARPMVEDALAALLERHRKEWSACRALAAEAVRIRDSDPVKSFERAKLAKILTEQMDIMQKGERRAWGVEDHDAPKGSVVVIERSAND